VVGDHAGRRRHQGSISAFPRVVLSEGDTAPSPRTGKVFERPFNVVNGVDGEVEVVAR
jgi:hypothetical protein